jgi:hypothetical protein
LSITLLRLERKELLFLKQDMTVPLLFWLNSLLNKPKSLSIFIPT